MIYIYVIIVCFILGIYFIITGFHYKEISECVLGGILIVFGILTIRLILEEQHVPTALDVYRGKTALEITYKDSISVDSTVIYKK